MENAITIPAAGAQALATREFSSAELDIIKSVIAKGASDTELKMFVLMAGKLGLDPLSKQIHMVKRRVKQGDEWVDAMTITVGIDGYRLVAERTGRYCPGRAPTYEYDAHGKPISATAYVLKLAGGAWHEVSAVAFWEEYAQITRDGKPTAMWAKMPRLMLGKCAEALALRRAFPAELSGVYTEDEMAQASSEPAPRVSVDAHAPIDADLAQRPAIAAPALAAPKPQPAAPAKRDDSWKVELTRLGKRAAEILQTLTDLPAEQRQQLEAAVTLARDVFAKNGSSTADERATAIAALKQALGESA